MTDVKNDNFPFCKKEKVYDIDYVLSFLLD
jgi:hypothetical protein